MPSSVARTAVVPAEEVAVLAEARIEAVVPVSDLDAALKFYGETLGLRLIEYLGEAGARREARLAAGEGSLTIYESEAAGCSGATLAAFLVEDLDAAVAGLEARGVRPIEYELPHLRTENGVATIGRTRVAWFADPDGNLLAVNTV
jgi:catechol 2,3-dioxygenase-like lactoylglutathione lyase family enzyme